MIALLVPLFQNGKRNLTERKKNWAFCCPNCLQNAKIVSPENGDEFESDDVVGGSTVLFMLCFLLLFSAFRGFSRVWLLLIRFKIESDDMLSFVDSTESVSSREESQGETSDEMEVVGQVQPYADEPLAHIRPYKRR